MSEILACIITYNPDLELLATNIDSIINDVDHIVVVDNNSANFKQIAQLASSKISFVENKENIGIAAALNQGLRIAEKKEMEYILTMDQDSYFTKGDVSYLKNEMQTMDKSVAMIGPAMRDLNSNFRESFDQKINFVKTIITSGAICRVKLLKEVGGWEEKLFIDKVDFDICYKLLLKKYKIVKVSSIFLNHNLGESLTKKFIINFLVTNHSSLRVYYQFRNTMYLQKKYSKIFFKDMLRLILSDGKKLVGILLFENNKVDKVKSAVNGVVDGFFNNYGKRNNNVRN